MKKTLSFIISLFVISLFAVSCGNKSDKDKNTIDSLQNETKLADAEVRELSSVINEVSASLDSIQVQEQMLFNNREGRSKDKVLAQLKSFRQLLAEKEAKIADLSQNIQSNNVVIQNLKKMVTYLNDQLNAKSKQIAELEEQVRKRDVDINELKSTLTTTQTHLTNTQTHLTNTKDTLTSTRKDLTKMTDRAVAMEEKTIQQDKQMNTVYYLVSTKKDLKAKGIIKGDGFFTSKKVDQENLNTAAFKAVDKRGLKTLTINSKSPKVISAQPTSSSTITKNGDGTSTLTITDVNKFWQASQFLVVQE